MIFARITGHGPRFIALLAQKRRERAAAYRPERAVRLELLAGSWFEIAIALVLAFLVIIVVAMLALTLFASSSRDAPAQGCPDQVRLNAIEAELQHRECEARLRQRRAP